MSHQLELFLFVSVFVLYIFIHMFE